MNLNFLLRREGVTVEIDESKFGRRKYHRGRRVKGENSISTQPCFTDPGSESNSRNIIFEHTKMDITLCTHVLNLGPTVISDGWTSDLGLDQMGYLHFIVNHSQIFVDPTTEAHLNIIEGNRKHVRSHMPSTGT
ncbi:hypothetical protein RF11_02005 [Thelohanellus kitauei]|uniref:Uncharacterized protein n=1 Tax=Thelohanellus kitauei TaxID=669202 RepID=A0A0C2IRE3_THEKT|nr:hypothetical protein RF11_02005 [Thelohanellus kitauei]